jgi:hypothetical protein
VLEKSEDELLALRNFGRKSYDELRDKLIELGFLKEGVEGMGGGSLSADAPARTIIPDTSAGDEELGPVAKALLEALKESGREDLIDDDDEAEDEEES